MGGDTADGIYMLKLVQAHTATWNYLLKQKDYRYPEQLNSEHIVLE